MDRLSPVTPADLAALAAAGLARLREAAIDEWERAEMVKFIAEADVDPSRVDAAYRDDVLAFLRAGLHDCDWVVRGWAVQAVGRFGTRADVPTLRKMVLSDPNEWVRSDAIDALYDLDAPQLVDFVGEVVEREESGSYLWWVAGLYSAAHGSEIGLPPVDSLPGDDEELLVRLLSTIRHLLPLEPNARAIAESFVSALQNCQDLPPIVAEERDALLGSV